MLRRKPRSWRGASLYRRSPSRGVTRDAWDLCNHSGPLVSDASRPQHLEHGLDPTVLVGARLQP